MSRVKRHLFFLFVVIALLAISTSVVFAKELGLLTISGPGIKGEMNLDDHESMMDLERTGFFDQASLIKPPENLGEGYNITAHLNLDGKLVPFVEMVYYPTEEGQPAYVHYTGRLNGEKLQPVDEWRTLNRSADTVLRNLLVANDIAVQSALVKAPPAAEVVEPPAPAKETINEPVTVPQAAPASASPAPAQPSYLIPAVMAAILLVAGAALVLRRRAFGHPTT